MSEAEDITLIIDGEDTYREEPNVFYMNPAYLPMLRLVQNNQFSSCEIRNTPIDVLTGLNLVYVLEKMKPTAPVEVTIAQPITVMQDYDAKQVEANAKLAGFENIEIKDTTVENNGKQFSTLAVSFTKPVKAKNTAEIQVTVTTTTKTTTSKTNTKKGKKY